MFNQDQNFSQYKFLKKILSHKRDGIEFGNILAYDLALLAYFNFSQRISLKHLLIQYIKRIDLIELYRSLGKHKHTLLYSIDRVDYQKQICEFKNELEDSELICLEKLPKRIYVNISNIVRSNQVVFKLLKEYKYTFKQKLYIAGKLCYYYNIITMLDRNKDINLKKKKLVLFNSAMSLENLFSQYFGKHGMETWSLTHGYFVEYNNFIPFDAINGENMFSDKILVWGKSSLDDLSKNYNYDPTKVEVVGNPKFPFKSIDLKKTFNNCLVILGRVFYEESNIEIINILNSIQQENDSINFYLKLHPTLDASFYQKKCNNKKIHLITSNLTLTDLLKSGEFDFTLVNNSTAYYEAMYYDLPCFRYKLSENEKFLGLDDYFEDKNTLFQLINNYKILDKCLINRKIQELLVSTIGMGLNRIKFLD